MVKKMLSDRKTVEQIEYRLEFDYIPDRGSGYSFDADASGNVRFSPEYEEMQRRNYRCCMENPDYSGPHFRKRRYTYHEPATAICECGEKIALEDQYMGASECPGCGRWHNMFGQTLVDPKYWEQDY